MLNRGMSKSTLATRKTLKILANDPDAVVRVNVAQNLNTDSATLDKLATDNETEVRAAVVCNPNTSQKTVEALAHDSEALVRRMAATTHRLSLETIEEIVNNTPFSAFWKNDIFLKGLQEFLGLFTDMRTCAPWFSECIKSPEKYESSPLKFVYKKLITIAPNEYARKFWMAFCPDTPTEILRVLARSKESEIRAALALNHSTPYDILKMIATRTAYEDEDSTFIFQNLILNPSSTEDILIDVAKKYEVGYFLCDIKNSNHKITENLQKALDEKLFEEFATCYTGHVFECASFELVPVEWSGNPLFFDYYFGLKNLSSQLAENPCTPDYILRDLLKEAEMVEEEAEEAEEKCECDLDEVNWTMLQIAANPNASASLLAQLAGKKHEKIREKVASNPSTPPFILGLLVQDPCETVACNAIANPNFPEDTFRKFESHILK